MLPQLKQKAHYHSYRRMKGRPKYYQCTHPDCTHYQHYDLIIGKRALCFRCGETFILTWQNLRLVEPHCENCTYIQGTKTPKKLKPIKELGTLTNRLQELLRMENENKG